MTLDNIQLLVSCRTTIHCVVNGHLPMKMTKHPPPRLRIENVFFYIHGTQQNWIVYDVYESKIPSAWAAVLQVLKQHLQETVIIFLIGGINIHKSAILG